MATWTAWEGPYTYESQDFLTAWALVANLPAGEARHDPISGVGNYANRLTSRNLHSLWAANGLTNVHRLRAMEFRFECRQGLAVFTENDPYDWPVYWAGSANWVRPPKIYSWPGTVMTTGVGRELSWWGFDDANDGVNAMTQLLANEVNIRIRPKNVRGGGEPHGWIRGIEVRVQYDDPVPRVPGLLTGIL